MGNKQKLSGYNGNNANPFLHVTSLVWNKSQHAYLQRCLDGILGKWFPLVYHLTIWQFISNKDLIPISAVISAIKTNQGSRNKHEIFGSVIELDKQTKKYLAASVRTSSLSRASICSTLALLIPLKHIKRRANQHSTIQKLMIVSKCKFKHSILTPKTKDYIAYSVFEVGERPFNITQNKRATIDVDHLFEEKEKKNDIRETVCI